MVYESTILPVNSIQLSDFLISREECRLRAYKNRALRRILGLKGGEIIGGWKELLNEKLPNVCFVSSVIRMTIHREWDGQGM
jgi:hypothetical protein